MKTRNHKDMGLGGQNSLDFPQTREANCSKCPRFPEIRVILNFWNGHVLHLLVESEHAVFSRAAKQTQRFCIIYVL